MTDKFGRDGEYAVIEGKRYLLIYQGDVADCAANGCVHDDAEGCAKTFCNAAVPEAGADVQRTLMTEPHDGHGDRERCPGCPHVPEAGAGGLSEAIAALDEAREKAWPLVNSIRGADTLEEAIGLSIGAASACWDNLSGAGVFESERAAVIAETLTELVRDYVR